MYICTHTYLYISLYTYIYRYLYVHTQNSIGSGSGWRGLRGGLGWVVVGTGEAMRWSAVMDRTCREESAETYHDHMHRG